ncbi:MAG TPA: BREX-4 system phosphatase PglZ [Firmicutes bacterium]|nr:BREX-4 system phosphatase PglZ [Candidatus Fermentithermobacillaceae bacterium]
MLPFASVDELLAYLRSEGSRGERFATRFILVQGCGVWEELVRRLGVEVDRVVSLSDFCRGADVLPDIQLLISYLKEETRSCRSILLLPLAEYLRLDPECAEVIRRLAEWEVSGLRRIYVPLLASNEVFFQEMEQVTRYRMGLLPQPWSLKSEGNFDIVVAPFCPEFPTGQVARGIKQYLSLWEHSSVRKGWLVTSMAPWLPTRGWRGESNLRIYKSGFEYVRNATRWEELLEEWGSPSEWEWLASKVEECEDFDGVARRLLNVVDYDGDHLFALWNQFDEHQRWLVWLWSRKRSKPGTYLHEALKDNNSIDDFYRNVIMTIFTLPRSPSFSRERKELLRRLGVSVMPVEFWQRYDKLTEPLDRVAVLSGLSPEEKQQLVMYAGEFATNYAPGLWWEYLEVAFPELLWYLQPVATGDEFADSYFAVYNRCRLKDRADDELDQLITKWAREQLLWNYPARSDLLAKHRAAGARVVWVDAMGAEWVGLLTGILTRDAKVECEVTLTKACLPTTTPANQEWQDGESVERGLDDIAHHYDYHFPESFLSAMDMIERVGRKVLALLSEHPAIVVTSDHGLSRFASTSDAKVNAPEGAQVCPPGRYAVLHGGASVNDHTGLWVQDRDNAILLTHGRFKGGGPCRGEIHGGATPEEFLVPVIVIRKKSAEAQQVRFEVTSVTCLNPKGEGVLTVRCSRKTVSVQLQVAGQILPGESESGLVWSFRVKGLKAGKYTGKLYTGNQFLGEVSFEVVKGIVQKDLGI